LLLAVRLSEQTTPVQYTAFVAVDLKRHGGWRAVHKMDSAHAAFSHQKESADSATGQSGQVCFPVAEREPDEIDEPFPAAFEMFAQAEQPLAMSAERIEADGNRPAIGPEEAITLVLNPLSLPIAGRVSTKENSQGAFHPAVFSEAYQGFRGRHSTQASAGFLTLYERARHSARFRARRRFREQAGGFQASWRDYRNLSPAVYPATAYTANWIAPARPSMGGYAFRSDLVMAGSGRVRPHPAHSIGSPSAAHRARRYMPTEPFMLQVHPESGTQTAMTRTERS
jgi:hypothetical protein